MNAALVLRDARCDARRPRTYALRVAYGIALAFVLGRTWSAVAPPGLLPTASDLAQAGRELYRVFFAVQFAAVSLLALVAGAETLSRELRAGTMRLLVLTPVSEAGIVASKWGAVMVQSAGLALCGAPVLAACAYLGAVGPGDIAAGLVATLANAGLAAACGLRGGSTARTPGGAMLRGALAYVGWALVPAVLAIPTAGVGLLMGPFLHPLYTAYYLQAPRPTLGSLAAAASAAVVGFGVLRILRRSSVTLERRMRELPDLLQPPAAEEPARPWALTWLPVLWRRPGVWERAPLIWKDLFTRPAALLSGAASVTLAIAAFGVWYLALVMDHGRSVEGLQVQLAILAAVVALNGAGLFTREKEARRLEPLLCGPLSSARIAASRLFSLLLSPEAAIAALMLAVTILVNAHEGWGQGLEMLGVALLVLLVVHFAAAAASLRMPTLHSAVGLTVGVLIVAWGVLPSAWPAIMPWISPGPALAAVREGEPWSGALARFAAAQGAVAAALAAWIVARLRPIVLEGRG